MMINRPKHDARHVFLLYVLPAYLLCTSTCLVLLSWLAIVVNIVGTLMPSALLLLIVLVASISIVVCCTML
jgi:hypothetical protein